jgi:hypothetical protein
MPQSRKDGAEVINAGELDTKVSTEQVDLLSLKTYVIADRLGAHGLLKAVNNNFVNDQANGLP